MLHCPLASLTPSKLLQLLWGDASKDWLFASLPPAFIDSAQNCCNNREAVQEKIGTLLHWRRVRKACSTIARTINLCVVYCSHDWPGFQLTVMNSAMIAAQMLHWIVYTIVDGGIVNVFLHGMIDCKCTTRVVNTSVVDDIVNVILHDCTAMSDDEIGHNDCRPAEW